MPAVLSPRVPLPANQAPRRRVLFLPRLHPKKGLLNPVRAWTAIRPDVAWELVLLGPDECGLKAELFKLVHECGLQDRISYGGEVWEDAAKWQAYRNADLFVLPTYSENFGLVVAEALGSGVPVITTRGALWQDLEAYQCGWWIDIGVEPLIAALRRAMATHLPELVAMGLRGSQLVQQKYAWAPIGGKMAEIYQWLGRQIPRPDHVFCYA